VQKKFSFPEDLAHKFQEISRLGGLKKAFLALLFEKEIVFKLTKGIDFQSIKDLPPGIQIFSKDLNSEWIILWGFEKPSPLVSLGFENLVTLLESQILKRKFQELSLCCEIVTNTIPQVVTIHDTEMRIIKANRTAEEFLNLPASRIIGRYCFEVFHGTKEPPPQCPARKLFEGESKSTQEMRLDSLGRIVQVNVSALWDEKKRLKGFVHIVSDLTERRELEEKLVLAQKLEALGTLAGGIVHDFNNLLTPILGFAEVALLQSEDPKLKGYLKNIVSCAKRAKELIAQIQTFSHQGSLDRKPLLIESLVKEAVKLIKAVLPKNIRIETDIKSCGYILGNPTEIQQILLNLLAMPFMP